MARHMQHVSRMQKYICICLLAWPENLHQQHVLSVLSQSTTDTDVAVLDCFAWIRVKNRCQSILAHALLSGFEQLARLTLPKLPLHC